MVTMMRQGEDGSERMRAASPFLKYATDKYKISPEENSQQTQSRDKTESEADDETDEKVKPKMKKQKSQVQSAIQ